MTTVRNLIGQIAGHSPFVRLGKPVETAGVLVHHPQYGMLLRDADATTITVHRTPCGPMFDAAIPVRGLGDLAPGAQVEVRGLIGFSGPGRGVPFLSVGSDPVTAQLHLSDVPTTFARG